MGLYKRDFAGMNGYIQRLKEEAERKEIEKQRQIQEEAARQQAAQWRRDVPVGPPTREQAFNLPDITKPQPKPKFQVGHTGPTADTSTPSLGQSTLPSLGQTVPAAAPEPPQPTFEPPRADERFNTPQVRQPDPLTAWNPPVMPASNTAAAMPLLPSLLPQVGGEVGRQLSNLGQGLARQWDDIDWSTMDWSSGLPQLTDLFPKATQPKEEKPVQAIDVTMDIFEQQKEKRRQEREYINALPKPEINPLDPNAGLAYLVRAASKPISFAGDALMNAVDVLGLASKVAQNHPLSPNSDATLGLLYGTAWEMGEQIDKATNNAGKKNIWEITPEEYGKLFNSVVNMAEFWNIATRNMAHALQPTAEQLKGTTQKQREYARALAIYNATSTLPNMAQTFDDYLNFPMQSADLLQRANQIAADADTLQANDPQREMMLAEAGRLGSEAVRLREMTPLDIYEKNYNMLPAFIADVAIDPLMAWDAIADVAQLGVAARRFRQGEQLADMAQDAVAGANKRVIDLFKDNPVVEAMKTQRSKTMGDTYTNFHVLSNLLSGVSTKGDIATVLRHVLDGSILNGIVLSEFNGAEMAVQADPIRQVVDFGWAGVKDWRFQKSSKAMANVANWIGNLPSLAGDATEIANKFEVQADLLGALTRAGAQYHNVSVVGDLPFGATRFQVKATAGNKAVVEYLDNAKNVVGQSAEMTLAAANRLQGNLQNALKKGDEFKQNWVKTVGDFRRNIQSTYSLNINPGILIGNALSGNLVPMIDRGFDMEFFRPIDQQVEYLLSKFGGVFPDARVATGVGKIGDEVRSASQAIVPQGSYDNLMGKLLNWSTLGLAKKGRELRQGTATLAGGRIKVGEEAMAMNIYQAAFRSFFEQEWGNVAPKLQQFFAKYGVADPKQQKIMVDRVIQAGLSGGRIDVAKAFQQIANGRVSLGLRSISPTIGDVLTGPQVLELDGLLANLTADTLGQVNQRITEIFDQQRRLLQQEGAKFGYNADVHYFTEADQAKDVADIFNALQDAAQQAGLPLDEAYTRAERVKQTLQTMNTHFLQLLQMAQDQPTTLNYIFDVWGNIQDSLDHTRRAIFTQKQQVVDMVGQIRAQAAQSTIHPFPAFREQRPSRMDMFGNSLGPSTPGGNFTRADRSIVTPISAGLPGDKPSVPRLNRLPENFKTLMPPKLLLDLKNVFVLSDEAAQGIAQVLDARAKVWAKYSGKQAQEWYTTHIRSIQRTADSQRYGLASVQHFKNQTDAVLRASNRLFDETSSEADRVAVLAHELGHIFNFDMDELAKNSPDVARQWKEAKRYFGIPEGSGYLDDGRMYEDEPIEQFASAFSQYLFSGRAPTPKLKGAFELFREWLAEVLNSVRGMLGLDFNQVRTKRVFDYILGDKPILKDAAKQADSVATGTTDDVTAALRPQGQPYPQAPTGAPVASRFTQAGPAVPHQQPPLMGRGQPNPAATYPRPSTVNPATYIPQMWKDYFANIDKEWEAFGQGALAQVEKARDALLSGDALKWAQQGLPNLDQMMPGGEVSGANELLSLLSVDPDVALGMLKTKLGPAHKDPRFDETVATARKTVDAMRARMFAMLARYPTVKSLDEFNAAFKSVARHRHDVMGNVRRAQKAVDDAIASGDQAAIKQAKAILAKTNSVEWNKYWNYAIKRFYVGAFRIAEVNYEPQLLDQLKFTTTQGGKTWTLYGPDFNTPNMWVAKDDQDNIGRFTVGKGQVPKEVVDRFNAMRAQAEREFYEQVGRIGAQAGQQGTAGPGAIPDFGDKETQAILQQVRRRVAEVMANYNQQVFIPGDLPRWYMDKLDGGELALKQVLQEVAAMNSQGFGRLGLDAVAEFNKDILPLFDNTLTGAQHYGREMVSLGVVDFVNNYHPDVLMGLPAPYHYWWSRMLKNVIERQLFNPKVSQLITHYWRSQEMQNREENQPTRNIQTIGGTQVDLGDVAYRLGLNAIPRWIPYLPAMAGAGWADPDRANRGYDYIREAMEEQGFPAAAKGWKGYMLAMHELANQLGLNTYSEWDIAMDALAGEPVTKQTAQGQLGNTSSLHRALGYGAVRLANWARENNIPLVPQALDTYAWSAVPNYMPHLVGRQASFEAAQGNLSDVEAGFVQDIARQKYTGEGPMPEQATLSPEAQAQYMAVENKTAMDYFVRSLLSFLSGAPIAAVYPAEMELREAQAEKRHADYEPSGNTAGSQSAYFGYTDPENPNYVPGLQAYENRYAVMNEEGPQVTMEQDRPALDATRQQYHAERQAIFEQFEAEQQAEYEKHPEWKKRQGLDAKSAYDEDFYTRREEALKAIDEKYPTIANEEKSGPTPFSLYGARPNETMEAAQRRLFAQAEENVAHLKPPEGEDAPPAHWDRYYAAREAELTRLMNDPQAASASVFNRALPMTGDKQPGPTADILRGVGEEGAATPQLVPSGQAPTTSSVPPAQGTQTPLAQATGVVPDPDNQWAEQMAAAEAQYGLPAGILQEVARNESNFDPQAKSDAGAMGLMQIMPATWQEWSKKVGVEDPWDPEQSIQVSAAYLDWLKDQLPAGQQDIYSIMVAYNWGIGRVQEKGVGAAPPETKAYANAIASNVGTVQPASTQPTGGVQMGQPFAGTHPQTQSFGVNPERYKSWGGHMGLDYAMPEGTPLLATEDATVVDVGNSPAGGTPSRPGTGGFGNWIILDFGNGYTAEYAHLSSIQVKPGDKVKAGQTIGLSGHTGVSDFPHLHFGVRHNGEYIDPHEYLSRTTTSQGLPATSQPASPAQTPSKPPAQGEGVAWKNTPQELLEQDRYGNLAPAKAEADKAIAKEFEDIEARARTAYPQYDHLWDEYRELYDHEKEAWRAANPMMKALNLAGYNPKEWEYIEKTFGKGIVEKWALLPPSVEAGGAEGARAEYYRKYPDVFLAKAWIDGRPRPYQEEGFDPTQPFERDFGKDYEKAKELFGDDIWNIVREYYTIPQYVRGADNTAWIAFKEKYPQYDQWREWWYGLIDDGTATASTFTPFGRGFSGFSGGFDGTDGMGEHPQQVNPVRFQVGEAPALEARGTGDWRKYLSETQLKGWRR